jgi:hypothetical protein
LILYPEMLEDTTGGRRSQTWTIAASEWREATSDVAAARGFVTPRNLFAMVALKLDSRRAIRIAGRSDLGKAIILPAKTAARQRVRIDRKG